MKLDPNDFPENVRIAIVEHNERMANNALQNDMLNAVLDELVTLPYDHQTELGNAAVAWAFVNFVREQNSLTNEAFFSLLVGLTYLSTFDAEDRISGGERDTQYRQSVALLPELAQKAVAEMNDARKSVIARSEVKSLIVGLKTSQDLARFLLPRYIDHLSSDELVKVIAGSVGFCYKMKSADLGGVQLQNALLDLDLLLRADFVPMMLGVHNRIEAGELRFDEQGIIVRA
jgi:hypothetical protein